jgi:hypothetical protein
VAPSWSRWNSCSSWWWSRGWTWRWSVASSWSSSSWSSWWCRGARRRLGTVVVEVVELVVVGSGVGFGAGAPVSSRRTASATKAARSSVAARRRWTASTYEPASSAAGDSAQSASWHRSRVSHHRRSAAEYASCDATRRLPGRAAVVRNTTGRRPVSSRARSQCATHVASAVWMAASFVPSATTTTSPSAPAAAQSRSSSRPDGAHVALPGSGPGRSSRGVPPSGCATRHCHPKFSDRPPTPSTAEAQPIAASARSWIVAVPAMRESPTTATWHPSAPPFPIDGTGQVGTAVERPRSSSVSRARVS